MSRLLRVLYQNYLKRFILFKSERHGIQDLLFFYSLYITFLITFISLITNSILGIPIAVNVFAGVGMALSIFLFWLSYKRNKIRLSQNIFLLFLFVSLNGLWIYSEGSAGSTLIIMQAILLMVIFFIPPQKMLFTIVAVFTNVLLLFALEIFAPSIIVKYESSMQRTLDIFVVTLIFFLLQLPVIIFAKKSIVKERNEAIQSEAQKTTFFLSLSHEIRTPMNAILGFSELLEDEELTKEERRHYLSIINQNGRTLLNLLNNVISFSKLESNQSTVAVSPIMVNELVQQVYYSLQQTIDKQKDIDFRMNLLEEAPTITTDVLKMYQILLNISFNAIKFTDKGFVEIGYSQHPHYVEFYVKDTGCGIPTDSQTDIFDRFKQAGQTIKSSTQHGAGLGLAICKRLAQLIDATITLDSEEGKGTTFFVKVPLKLSHR